MNQLKFFLSPHPIVFDPNESIDETNEEYKKVYDEYKHLVDFMLGSFMEEMQISPEQFEVACLAGKHSSSGLSFHQGLFQQVFFSLLTLISLLPRNSKNFK